MSEELHSLSGAYVLDALTDEERRDFERHLERCSSCRDEVASLREVTPLLAETAAAEPPAALRDEVLARARTTRQDPPPVEEPEAGETVGRHRAIPFSRRGRTWVALAAAATLVVGGGLAWQQLRQDPDPVEQVADAPDAHSWRAEASHGGTVTVTRSDRLDKAVVRLENLPEPGQGHAYQAWLQRADGSLVSAGMVPGDGEAVLEGDIETAVGVGLSVEPADGSKQPTTDPVALIELG